MAQLVQSIPAFKPGGSAVRSRVLPQIASQLRGFFVPMQFYCYILYSAVLDKYYVGHTGDDLGGRLRRHNSDHEGYTGGKGDWGYKYLEPFATKKEAYAREREIKSWKSSEVLPTNPLTRHAPSP